MKFFYGLKEVYSKPKYLFLTLFSGIFFYLLSLIVSNFSQFRSFLVNYNWITSISFLLFPPLVDWTFIISQINTILISLLFGSYIALALHMTLELKKINVRKSSFFGVLGIFLGIISPGCFVGGFCGLGFASVIGLSGFFLSLPFKGLEISFVSLLILCYANFSIANKIGIKSSFKYS